MIKFKDFIEGYTAEKFKKLYVNSELVDSIFSMEGDEGDKYSVCELFPYNWDSIEDIDEIIDFVNEPKNWKSGVPVQIFRWSPKFKTGQFYISSKDILIRIKSKFNDCKYIFCDEDNESCQDNKYWVILCDRAYGEEI